MTIVPNVTDLPVGELAASMGITLQSASRDALHATMPVRGNRQPFGLLHGGASAVLAETVGSVHAALLAPDGYTVVGVELNCTHHRAATAGTVHAVSTPLHAGRTVITLQIEISTEGGERVCTSRLTCLARPPR